MTSDLVKKKMSSLMANKHGVRERIVSLFGPLKTVNSVGDTAVLARLPFVDSGGVRKPVWEYLQ